MMMIHRINTLVFLQWLLLLLLLPLTPPSCTHAVVVLSFNPFGRSIVLPPLPPPLPFLLLPPPPQDTSQQNYFYYYFAYGSNMLPETMTELRQITPINATAAVLPNYRLRFTIPGVQFIEPSAAVIEEVEEVSSKSSPSSRAAAPLSSVVVHGVLYKLSKDDFIKVSMTEGVPFAYRWKLCSVYPYVGDGNNAGRNVLLMDSSAQPISAYTLISGITTTTTTTTTRTNPFRILNNNNNNNQDKDDIPPSKSYRDILIDGAKYWNMDQDYIEKLENIPYAKNLLLPEGVSRLSLDIATQRRRRR